MMPSIYELFRVVEHIIVLKGLLKGVGTSRDKKTCAEDTTPICK
jgi:hypothetical protein